ncbi:protein RKD5-like, partial [Trifolium medium]|nr:protein RKD5-like [Trifolium medium]
NPKLQAIPNLLNDLHMIYKLVPKEERRDTPESSTAEESKGNNNNFQPPKKVFPVLNQDLNCLPYEDDESELLDDKSGLLDNKSELLGDETDFESSSDKNALQQENKNYTFGRKEKEGSQ